MIQNRIQGIIELEELFKEFLMYNYGRTKLQEKQQSPNETLLLILDLLPPDTTKDILQSNSVTNYKCELCNYPTIKDKDNAIKENRTIQKDDGDTTIISVGQKWDHSTTVLDYSSSTTTVLPIINLCDTMKPCWEPLHGISKRKNWCRCTNGIPKLSLKQEKMHTGSSMSFTINRRDGQSNRKLKHELLIPTQFVINQVEYRITSLIVHDGISTEHGHVWTLNFIGSTNTTIIARVLNDACMYTTEFQILSDTQHEPRFYIGLNKQELLNQQGQKIHVESPSLTCQYLRQNVVTIMYSKTESSSTASSSTASSSTASSSTALTSTALKKSDFETACNLFEHVTATSKKEFLTTPRPQRTQRHEKKRKTNDSHIITSSTNQLQPNIKNNITLRTNAISELQKEQYKAYWNHCRSNSSVSMFDTKSTSINQSQTFTHNCILLCRFEHLPLGFYYDTTSSLWCLYFRKKMVQQVHGQTAENKVTTFFNAVMNDAQQNNKKVERIFITKLNNIDVSSGVLHKLINDKKVSQRTGSTMETMKRLLNHWTCVLKCQQQDSSIKLTRVYLNWNEIENVSTS